MFKRIIFLIKCYNNKQIRFALLITAQRYLDSSDRDLKALAVFVKGLLTND